MNDTKCLYCNLGDTYRQKYCYKPEVLKDCCLTAFGGHGRAIAMGTLRALIDVEDLSKIKLRFTFKCGWQKN